MKNILLLYPKKKNIAVCKMKLENTACNADNTNITCNENQISSSANPKSEQNVKIPWFLGVVSHATEKYLAS